MANKKDFSSGFFLFLVGLLFTFFSIRHPMWSKSGPDEGLFPLVVAISIMGFSLIVVGKSFFVAQPREREKTSEGQKRKIIIVLKTPIIYYIMLILVYGLLLDKMGFLITSAVLMFPILRFVEKESWKVTLLVGFGSIITSYILFVRFLGVPLPRGIVGIW